MRSGRVASLAIRAAAAVVLAGPAFAQARNPFSVGISEGGGPTTGVMGWVLSQQGWFEHALSAAVRASRADGSALPWLAALSFVYGILHAAGPGHGKAVLSSYMVASRRALRRGIALSFLAALLQAAVAVAFVGVMALLVRATAVGMRDGAAMIEQASYVGVAALGLWLTWRRGAAFVAALRPVGPPVLAFAGAGEPRVAATSYQFGASARVAPNTGRSAFACTAAVDAALHLHGPDCGHFHAPDPAMLGDDFSWREAASTVAAAGARPCSGAILVLVFSIDQQVFRAGVISTLVMALGTAITTAALASIAVLAKGVALRLVGRESGRGALVLRGLEVLAALVVLAVGLSLMFGMGSLQLFA